MSQMEMGNVVPKVSVQIGISEAVVKSDPFYPFRVLWNDKEEMKGKDQNAKKDFQ